MANPEVTAALPRPESLHPPQHLEATPPTVETISGTTSEGSETLRDPTRHNSVSGHVNHSTLSRTSHSPRSENSPANNASPRLSAQESRIASGVIVASDVHRASSSSAEQCTIPHSAGTPLSLSANVVAPANLSIPSSSIDGIFNGSPHHSSTAPKRFTAVNVNRKFLEKSSSTASSVPAVPVTTGAKLANQTNLCTQLPFFDVPFLKCLHDRVSCSFHYSPTTYPPFKVGYHQAHFLNASTPHVGGLA